MDYKTLLTIVILVLISSQLWNILWDIGKGALYIVILLLALTYIEPETGEKIKEFIKKIINLDFSLITNALSTISKILLTAFGKLPKIVTLSEDSNVKEEYKVKE